MASEHNCDTLGVVLAGGESRRMAVADKCLLTLAGRPLLAHVVARAEPQVNALVLSANGDPRRFAAFELAVVADVYPGHCGPLAGIISAMAYASKLPWQPRWLATFPSDAPLAPKDWVDQLRSAAVRGELDVAVVADAVRAHYTFALWSLKLLPTLQRQFAAGERALHRVVRSAKSEIVLCRKDSRPFTNLNTPADLQQLEEDLR